MEAQARVTIPNPSGLHARPCTTIVTTAMGFQSDLRVSCGGRHANGKSIMELITLSAPQHAELELRASGPDAEALVERLAALVEAGFDESS